MLEVAPFQAIRYDFDALGGDVSTRIAPPYDVLDRHDKQELIKRDERWPLSAGGRLAAR